MSNGVRRPTRAWARVARHAVLALVTVAVAACSGVPSSSSPDVVRAVGGGVAPAPNATITPGPGADPRTIVSDFLLANGGPDSHHNQARGFLTQDARSKWTDTTATIVNSLQVGLPDSQNNVQVSGTEIGSLDKNGVYTPFFQAASGPKLFTFGMQKVQGQWRIAQLGNGVLLDLAGFTSNFKPRLVYFFDQSQRLLVPDLRYSALSDQPLCSWLLEQLGDPPRAELQSLVASDLPADTTHAAVTCSDNSVVVNLPGANLLDDATRRRLAAQLANTFVLDNTFVTVRVTDAGRAVAIPQISSPFSSVDFTSYFPPATQPPLYYVHDGGLVSGSGTAQPGTIGTNAYAMASVALAAREPQSPLVAAVSGKGSAQHLLVGTTTSALLTTSLAPGAMSRPSWAPGLDEVWIADDGAVWRISAPSGTATNPNPVTLTERSGQPVTGSVRAIAFSPDGVRVALVVQPGGSAVSQVWVGTVARSDKSVAIDNAEPVTPPEIDAVDVAWNDTTTIYLIGEQVSSPSQPGYWSVQSDGSLLRVRPTTGLPAVPDALAAAPNALSFVSVNGSIWTEKGSGSWSPPFVGGGIVAGTAPTYVE